MELHNRNIKELFENINGFVNLTQISDPVCILVDGVNDLIYFKQIIRFFDSKATISQIYDQLVFVLFSIDNLYFEKIIKKQFEIMHIEVFSIFPKKEMIDILTREFKNIDRTNFCLLFFTIDLNFQLTDFSFQNNQEILQSSADKHLYKFENYNDLVSCYEALIQSKSCWPIFVIPPQNPENDSTILNYKISNKPNYPLFSPIKSLYYFSFIEKVHHRPIRILDANDIYSIEGVEDVQISRMHNKSFEIRTFLGFMNKFQCFQTFQYFIQISESHKNYFDVQLENEDRISMPSIKYNFYYLEIQSLFFDSSILFSLNCIDLFNFEGFTYYSFDDLDDMFDALDDINTIYDNDIYYQIKNFKFLEKRDLKYFFSDEIEEKDLFYMIFRMKCFEESKKRKRYLLSLLKDSAIIKHNLLCKLDNKSYTLVGFENDQKRNEVFITLLKSKFSKPYKIYVPITEENIVMNNTNKKPIFQPNKNLLYIYFQENKRTEYSMPSNFVRPLFGVSNIIDVQQNYLLPGCPNEYTFLGFSNQENMNKAIDHLSYKVNEIKGRIFRFNFDQINYKYKKKTRIKNDSEDYIIFTNNNTTNIINDDKNNPIVIDNAKNTENINNSIENISNNTENIINDYKDAENIKIDDKLIVNLSDYINKELIGNGSFGLVYRVENKRTKKKYAVKTKSHKSSDFSDFLLEINFYKKYKHPLILSLHGYSLTNFENEKIPIIFLEYMSNGSLDKIILHESKSISKSKRYIILYGIAVAMEFLHSRGVYHRDLKPENVLLDDNYYPRICDFGLSLITENREKSKKGEIGSPKYMAPEIFKEKDCNSGKVDIYSFSLIAYELLTEKESFPSYKYYNIAKLKHDVIKGIRPDLSFISDEEILAFFQRCWSSEPSERPDFSEICEIIRKPKFKLAFHADELEILKYHYWFYDQLEESEFNIHTLQQAEKNGNINLMVEYGNRLFLGIGIQIDKEEAFRLFKIGVDHNNSESMYYLGIYSTDKEEGNKYLKMAADLDNMKAMNEYGKRLLEEKNEKALFYFKKAAQLGNEESFLHLGEMYLNGIGTEINKEKASEYFQMAADKGNVQAMYEYAHMLHLGDGIKSDYMKAGEYYKLAAFYGNVNSMTNFGLMLKDGKLPTDLNESKNYLQMASKLGDADGMFHYGNLLCVMAITGECENENEATRLYEEAAEYFKKAADKGYIEAYTRYGILYTKGFIKTNDLTEPIEYLKHAAYNGSDDGIIEYLAAKSNLPIDHDSPLNSIEETMERVKLTDILFKNGHDKTKAFALSSGFTIDPLYSFIKNDHAIYNDYYYNEEEEDEGEIGNENQNDGDYNIKSNMNKLLKRSRKHKFTDEEYLRFLNIFQHYVDYNNKTIDDIEMNCNKSFQYDPDKYYLYFSNNTIPAFIQYEIELMFKSIPTLNYSRSDLCHPKDPNDIYTFYFIPSHFHNFIQDKISEVFHHYNIDCYFPQSCESVPFTDYLYFDEKLFSSDLLEMFMKNLELNQDILEIKPNIFNGKEIVTVLIIKKGTEKNVIQFIRSYLLNQKVLFKTFLYPLQNNIIINEKMIFKGENDFYAVLKEIKKINSETKSKINSQIINVERNVLYLYEFYPQRKLFQRFSFICFQNEIDKMEALNYINSIVFKNKKFVEYNIEYFYASLNEYSYPSSIQKLIPDLLNHFKGFKDLQRNVVSIESPVERTYIGFDTFHHLKKCHFNLSKKLKILTICPDSKLFWIKKGTKYLEIKHNFDFKINFVIDLVSKLASDVQEKCSELGCNENQLICITYIGFSSDETFEDAKKVLEACSFAQNGDVSINEHYEIKYLNIDEPRESYLFYDSL